MDLQRIDKALEVLVKLSEQQAEGPPEQTPDEEPKGGDKKPEGSARKGELTNVVSGEGVKAHFHRVWLNSRGDGETEPKEGHTHRVVSGVVQPAMGHSHEVLQAKPQKSKALKAGSFKRGSEPKKRKSDKKPVGVGSMTPDVAGGPAPGGEEPPPGGEEERPEESFDWHSHLTEEYGFEGAIYERVGWPSRQMAYEKYEILESILRHADHVLDVGCGNGLLYDWILKEQDKNVVYWGVDQSESFLGEFVERYPTIAGRLRKADVLSMHEEDLPREHFDVAACFGLTSDLGEGEEQYSNLRRLVEFMTSHADTVVIEFWDRFKFDRSTTEQNMVPPSVWVPKRVAQVFGEADFRVDIVRPLTDQDFAVVAVRNEIRGAL